jgi:hypothetical protein
VPEAKILHLPSGIETFSVTTFPSERSTGGHFKLVKSDTHYQILYKLSNIVWKQTLLCSLWPTCHFRAVRHLVTTWPLSICTPCTYATQSARGWVYELWSAVGGDFGLSCWFVRDLWLLRDGVKVIECSISQPKLGHWSFRYAAFWDFVHHKNMNAQFWTTWWDSCVQVDDTHRQNCALTALVPP